MMVSPRLESRPQMHGLELFSHFCLLNFSSLEHIFRLKAD